MSSNEIVEISIKKIKKSIKKQIILGILAGMFIGLSAFAASVIFSTSKDLGMAKFIGGIVFSTGLICVVLTGSQLFTGNVVGIASVVDKKATIKDYCKNLLIIYMSNMLGALLIAILIHYSGILTSYNNEIAHYIISVANKKVELSFINALTSGILCNMLVCLAVILSMYAKDIVSKILVIIFPILVFIISGFEHCVANMFYIPTALLTKGNEILTNGIDLSNLNIGNYVINNLLPVTIGNIIGGMILSLFIYYSTKEKA